MTKNHAASRRSIVKGLAGTLGAAALAPDAALAQQPNAATGTPPSVITNPPRQWGRDAPPSIYPDPDIIVIDPSFRQYLLGHHRDPSRGHRLSVGRGSGLVERGPVFRVQRRAGQHPVSLPVGQPAGDAVPQAVQQQQRQFVRFPGAPALDRGLLPPRGALGTRRHDDGDRRFVRRQAAELAERPGAASRRQHLVHRSAVRRHAVGRPSGRRRRADQSAGSAQSAHRRRERRRTRGRQAAVAERGLSLGPGRPTGRCGHRGPAQRSQRDLLRTRLQDAVCDQHRQGAGRQPQRRHAHDPCVRCAGHQSSPISGSSWT